MAESCDVAVESLYVPNIGDVQDIGYYLYINWLVTHDLWMLV